MPTPKYQQLTGLTKQHGTEMSPSRLGGGGETCPGPRSGVMGPLLISPPRLSPNCSPGTKAASEETSPPRGQMVSVQGPLTPLDLALSDRAARAPKERRATQTSSKILTARIRARLSHGPLRTFHSSRLFPGWSQRRRTCRGWQQLVGLSGLLEAILAWDKTRVDTPPPFGF